MTEALSAREPGGILCHQLQSPKLCQGIDKIGIQLWAPKHRINHLGLMLLEGKLGSLVR